MKPLPEIYGWVLAAVAVAQWLAVAGASVFSRAKLPKNETMRRPEKALIASSVVLFAAWFVAFDGTGYLGLRRTRVATASAVATRQTGSCASIKGGMTGAEVQASLGRPDEIRPDEEVRGPGAVQWLYRDSRCAVHLLDDKVEFVD